MKILKTRGFGHFVFLIQSVFFDFNDFILRFYKNCYDLIENWQLMDVGNIVNHLKGFILLYGDHLVFLLSFFN
jgi:hypothetical protein